MGRTCGEPDEIKKNTHPKNITALFCEQVLPFVDMTVKGWVWYQGENNMGAPKGNSLVNLGSGKPIGNQLEPSWKGPPSQTPRAGGILAFVRVYHACRGPARGVRRTRGEPSEIELAAIGLELNGSWCLL